MKGVEFLVDESGNRKAVLIDLKKHRLIWEDFYDTLRAKERENEPRESLEQVKQEVLRHTGFTEKPYMAQTPVSTPTAKGSMDR